MKKIWVCCLSIIAFLFLFTTRIDALEYNGRLGYEYSAASTQFFFLNDNDNITVTLHIKDTSDIDMIYDGDYKIWYASVNGDLKGKEYNYEICYSDSTCIDTIDPFANSINTTKNMNVILDANSTYIEGYNDRTINIYDNYSNSIYAIDAEKFVKNLSINIDVEVEEEEIQIPGLEIETPPVVEEEYKDSIFNRLTAHASNAESITGFYYILSLGMKNLEIGDLYDSNNYFAANQDFSSKDNNYSSTLELKKMILKYKENGMNLFARMDLLNPGEELKESLKNISSNFILESGKINLEDPMMKRYILDVYKYWVQAYRVDGFYILDADSYGSEYLNLLISELKEINNKLFIYTDSSSIGEYKTNDNLQSILFGNLNSSSNEGIINGNYSKENFDKLVNAMYSGYYSDLSKAKDATKVINNIGSINDLDIYSKLMLVSGLGVKESEILSKVKLGLYTIYSSTGIPRLVAGNEFLNTTTISSNDIASTDQDKMVCNNSKTLCYAKNDLKTIDWGYLVKNGSDISKMMNYRTRYLYQYPNYITMLANESVDYNTNYADKGILYLTINYAAKYKGDIEKSVLIINYSNNQIDMEAISDRAYGKVNALLGKLTGDEEAAKVYEYTFYTFSQTKEQKFSNIVYILIAGVLLLIIFGIRYLLIWMLKKNKGIDYKEYTKEQKQIRKDNKKKKVKNEKEPGVFETYLSGDSFVDKLTEKLTKKREKKVKPENESTSEVETKNDEENKKD